MPAVRLFSPDGAGASEDRLSVCDVIALYVRHCTAENVHCAPAARDRDYIFGLFTAAYPSLAVDDAKPYHLRDFVEAHPEWKSVGTRRAKANMVRAAFNWAWKDERIGRNPFANVRYAESERRPEMPDKALEAIETLANKPFERILRFLRLTGCRASEVCQATWADVDLDRGILTIPKHKSRKRTGKAKVVALVAEAVDLLRSIPQTIAAPAGTAAHAVVGVAGSQVPAVAEPIFLNTHGQPYTRHNLWKCLKNAKVRNRIDTAASIHGIRHTFAGTAVANGAPLSLVAAQLGHANSRVTEAYYVDLSNKIEQIRAAASLGMPKK